VFAAQQFTGASGFPYCRCIDYSPSSSPYYLTGPTVTPLENGAQQITFLVQATPNANTTSFCYQQLAASLHKIAFETSYSCFAGRAFYDVTINGNTQHFDVSVQLVDRQQRHCSHWLCQLVACLHACSLPHLARVNIRYACLFPFLLRSTSTSRATLMLPSSALVLWA
jgi:hypothetical protein